VVSKPWPMLKQSFQQGCVPLGWVWLFALATRLSEQEVLGICRKVNGMFILLHIHYRNSLVTADIATWTSYFSQLWPHFSWPPSSSHTISHANSSSILKNRCSTSPLIFSSLGMLTSVGEFQSVTALCTSFHAKHPILSISSLGLVEQTGRVSSVVGRN